jgi:PAS domain S-box-containing protein
MSKAVAGDDDATLNMFARQLQERELYLQTVLQSIQDGFWILNAAGKVIDANEAYCKMSGYTLAELQQLSTPDMDADETPAETTARMERIMRNGSELFETRHRRKDGSIFDVEISVTYHAEAGGRFICFCRDVTDRKRAEQNYQMLFREMLDGFALHEIIVDEQGTPIDYRFLSVNPAFEYMTGLKDVDIRGRTVLEILPDTEPFWINTYGRVALTGEPAFFENYSHAIDKYFEVTAFQPAQHQFACIFRDITAHKQAEMDLKSAYTKLEALWSITSLTEADVKTISDHILMSIGRMTGSKYGFYGFINEDESAMTIHSWSGEAMKDCSLVDKPQHFPIDEAGVWAEAIRKREPFIFNHYSQNHSAKKGLPVGHVPLKNLLVVPHFSHGKITSVAAVANRAKDYDQDDVIQINALLTSVEAIVESKRSEEALRKSEERYHLIDEASQDLIYSYDQQSRFTHANSSTCRLLGLKPEQIIGKTHEELGFSPEQCQEWARLHQQVYQSDQTVTAETTTAIQDGAIGYFEVVLNPIHDESGQIIGIAGMTRDINARKQAEAQINEQLDELRRWHNITLGRENRILELKMEVNQLLAKAGQPPRYSSVLK